VIRSSGTPPQRFESGFGQEWFIRCDAEPGLVETDLFDGLG